mmetsp:Transcript_15128/g.16828  ORF Transcript_15128/g.16828 Transcript_15128/m.16828 type:complete len:486 (-) Transcript_15128:108-1565(-)
MSKDNNTGKGGGFSFGLSSTAAPKKRRRIQVQEEEDGPVAELITKVVGSDIQTATKKKDLIIPLTDRTGTTIARREPKKLRNDPEANRREKEQKKKKKETLTEELQGEVYGLITVKKKAPDTTVEYDDEELPDFLRDRLNDLKQAGAGNEQAILKKDLDILPDYDSKSYGRVSVEGFGEALMRGMGWKPGKAIGRNCTEVAKIYDPKPRHHRLGLGAKPKPPELRERRSYSEKEKRKIFKQLERRGLVPGVLVSCVGKWEGHYGVLLQTGLEQVIVRLSDKQEVLIEHGEVSKVVVDSFSRNHPAVLFWRKNKNRLALTKYIDQDEEPHDYQEPDRDGSKRKREVQADNYDKPAKKRKSSSREKKPLWLMPDIRVRVRTKKPYKGKYYAHKGCVMDVLPNRTCSIRLETGNRNVIYDIRQRDLETVLPKVKGVVVIVRGERRNEKGKLVKVSYDKDIAQIQMFDDMTIFSCKLDDAAQYLGRVDY